MKTRKQQIALVCARFACPSRHAIAGLLIAVAMASAASAQTTATWYGSGTSAVGGTGTWNTSGTTNWSSNGTSWFAWNNTTNSSDTAVFAGTSGTVTLGTGITAGGLQFDTTGYTITSNTITLTGTASQIMVASTAIGTIASALSGTGGITKAGAGTLRLSGSNTYAGTTTITSGTLQIGAGSTTGFLPNTSPVSVASGAVFAFNRSDNLTYGGTVSGAGGFVKLGAGQLTLTGSSSYTGGTWIDGGTVVMNVAATAGSTSALGTSTSSNVITINSGTLTGGALRDWLDSATAIASGGGNAHSVVINAGGALNGASGWVTGLGNVTMNGGTILVTTGVNDAFRGSFVLAGDITVSGSVASSITNTGNANAVMVMSNGAGSSGGTRTFTVNDVTNSSASDLTVVARLGNGTVVKAGAGTLELAPGGVGTPTVPVNWQVNAGTLLTTTTGAISTGTVTLASSGTFDLGGQSGVTVGRIVAAGSLLNSSTVAASTAGPVDLSGTNTAQIGGPGSLTLSGTVSNGGFTKVGSGTLTLSAVNTFSGTTRVNAGVLSVTNASGLQNSTLDMNSGTVSFGQDSTLGGLTGSQDLDLSGRTLSVGNNNTSTTYSGGLSNGALTKIGTGTLALAGSNTYSGTTTVTVGTLQIGSGGTTGSISDSSPVSVSSGAVFAFNRSDSLTYGGTVSGAGGLAQLGSNVLILAQNQSYTGTTTIASGTLQIGNGGTTGSISDASPVANSGVLAFSRSDALTYGGTVSGTGGLSMAGSSLLSLTGANTYTGATTITAGTLQIGAGGTTGSIANASPVSVASGAVFAFNRSDSLTYGGTVSGAGGLVKLGAGALILSGSNTYAGTTTITSGTLQIGAGGATGFIPNTSPVSVASGAAFAFNRSDNLTYSGTVSGAGGLVKLGAGNLTLTGSSSYTGGTLINGGIVTLSVPATAGSTSALGTSTSSNVITINSGTLTGGAMYHWLDNTAIASGGGNAHSVVINANGVLRGSSGWITGLGNVTMNGGSIQVTTGVNGGQYRGSFTLAGDITVSGSVASSITNTGNGNAVMVMSNGADSTGGTRTFTVNDVTNSSASDLIVIARLGNGTVIKAGAGTLELAPGGVGTPTVPLNWQVNAGTLLTTTTDAISTGTVTVASSGTFDLGGQSGVTVGRIVAAGSLLNSSTVAASTAGPLDLSGTNSAQIGGPGSLTLSGTISNGGFTKVGSGTLTLSAVNTFSGTTRVNAGVLSVTNASGLQNSTLDMNSGDSGTVSFGQDSTLGGLTGSQNLDLSGRTLSVGNNNTSTTYSGGLSNGALTKIGTGTLVLAGANTYSGTTTVSAGALVATSTTALPGVGTSAIVFNGGILGVRMGGAGWTTDQVDSLLSGATKTAGALGIDTTNGDVTQWTPFTTTNFGPSLGLAKLGSGTLALNSNNTYAGATVIAGGVLQAGGTGALSSGTITFSGGALQYMAASAGTDWATRIKGSGSAIALDTNGQNVTLAGIIASTNTGGLTKTGNGTLVVSAASTYTGLTTVSQGTLQSGSTTSATTAIPAGSYAVAAGAKVVFARNIDNVAFTTQGISGAGDVEFQGQTGGYFAFRSAYTAAATYTGQTIVNLGTSATWYQGALWLEKDNVLPSATVVNMQSGKIYTRNQTSTGISVAGITGSAGTFITTDATGGTQKWTVNVASGTSYTYAGGIGWDGNGTISQANGNNISFTKAGAGTQILSGSNTYSGTTTISGGRLEIASAGRINGTARIAINGSGAELKYNSATALTQPITFTQGTISGTGTINTAVTVGTSDIVSPGNSPGIQAYTSGLTFASGGSYLWEINNWTGSPGTNYDQLAVSGSALNITATSGSTFTIALTGLTAGNVSGVVPGFSPGTTGTTFMIATSAAGITGFDKSKFTIDTSAFTNNNTLPANAGFWLSTNGGSTSLILNYAPSATYNLSAAASAAAIRVGGTSTITATVTSSTASLTNPDSLAYTGLALSGGVGTLSSTSGTLAGGATSSGNAAFTTLATGSYAFAPSVTTATNVNLGTSATPGSTSGVTVTVYNPASATSLTGTTVVLTNVHVGQSFGTQSLSISNTGTAAAAFQEGLAGSYTSATGDASGSGSFGNLFAGSASAAISVGLGNASTATAGVRTGTVTLGFTSTGTTSSGATGLTPLPLASQTVAVIGTVFNYAAANTISTPISLGNVYVGGTFGTSALTISNTAPGTFSEGLNASFGSATGGASNNSGSFTNLAAQTSNTTSLVVGLGGNANTGSAGALSGTQAITLVSNGANSGLSNTNLASQTLSITGTVWNQAAVNSITSPVTLTNVHVGGTFGTSALTIQNTSAVSSYTEVLGATATTSGQASSSGSVVALAGGSTSTAISVGLGGSSYTGSAGVRSGTATIAFTSSGGPGSAVIQSQAVAVTGTVFNYAAANAISGTVNLGTVLKGMSLSQSLSITNTAPATYSEKLDAVFGTLTGGVTTNAGSVSLLAAGGTSNAMSIYLASGSAGTALGSAQVNFTSNGLGTSDLGTTSLSSQTVSLTATVLDPALASFMSGSTATTSLLLDFGSVNQNSVVSPLGFDLYNLVQTSGYTADLALLSILTGTGNTGAITTTLTSTFNSLEAGSFNGYTASLATDTLGAFTNTYTLSFKSANGGAVYSGDTTQTLTLTVQGIIVVPEPGTLALAGMAIVGVGCMVRRKRRAAA